MLTCPKCGLDIRLEDVWYTDTICCVHCCGGKEIADVGCPDCGARIKQEIKEVLS